MASKPTQRTLEWLRERSYHCAIVEHWNAHVGIRQDLFGAIDILALGPGPDGTTELLAIQTTSGSNVSARVAKILALPAMRLWVESGNRLVVHGWTKKARPWKPGEKRVGVRVKKWVLREEWIVVGMFEGEHGRHTVREAGAEEAASLTGTSG